MARAVLAPACFPPFIPLREWLKERRVRNGKRENRGEKPHFCGQDSGGRSPTFDEHVQTSAHCICSRARMPPLRFGGARVSRFSGRYRGQRAGTCASAAGARDSARSGPGHSPFKSFPQRISRAACEEARGLVRTRSCFFHQQWDRSDRRGVEAGARLLTRKAEEQRFRIRRKKNTNSCSGELVSRQNIRRRIHYTHGEVSRTVRAAGSRS